MPKTKPCVWQVFNVQNVFLFLKHSEKSLTDITERAKRRKFVLRGVPSNGCVFAGQGARGLAMTQRKDLRQVGTQKKLEHHHPVVAWV